MSKPVAIITGAGRGIGRATAIALAGRGYDLALISRTAAELQETARLAGAGRVVPCDVTDAEAVQAAVENTVGNFGGLDAIVHCAGLAPVLSIAEMTIQQWHAVINANLSAAFYLSKAAWPTFVRQKKGVIVNVSSVASRDPFPGFAAYGAAKAALNLFGLSAAREGFASGIRVHTIAPGAVETDMFRAILSPQQYPTEKTLSPADVADVIVRCVTGELRHSSGEVIYLHKEM